jgi:hypothetical protein
VIIETRKREREKRIERAMRSNDDDDDDDGDQEENEEKHEQRRIKKKMGVLFFINVESAARHNTEEERRNSCSLYPSIVFVCMLGCEVVCEPTNRKKSFVKRRRERKRTIVFLSFYFWLVLFLYSNHMMLDVDITQLRTQLAQCQQQLFANAHTFCSCRQRQENRKSTAFLSISVCPYESTHMRRIEKE